ncbi:MAG: MerR family transcriptional regulator [Candidatus Cloacimonetes bacterium]|nr:MerR family transcriptional regulator [Candidatus Cloacimonadota bacterium]
MKKYYYSMGEVCNLLGLKPHVIRFWETEFSQLQSKHVKGKNRRYTSEEINCLKAIKDMLYNQKYTIEGARKKLKNAETRKEIKSMTVKSVSQIKNEIITDLKKVKTILEKTE